MIYLKYWFYYYLFIYRELINPVLNVHNLNVENYNIYVIENTKNNENINNKINGELKLIDLNTICDKYINSELILKRKLKNIMNLIYKFIFNNFILK